MTKISAATAVVVCAVLLGIYFWPPGKVAVPDHLCAYVSDTLHLTCVDVLQSESSMHPGSVVAYRGPSGRDAYGRASIPSADLLNSACRVPGTQTDLAGSEIDRVKGGIGLPEFTYQLKNALEEGLTLPGPKLQGASIEAGPKFSRIASVKISNDKAWIATWDENAAAQILSSCNIKQQCIDRVRSSENKVVATAAVVEGLKYDFSDSDNKTLSLSVGIADQPLKLKAGGKVELGDNAQASLTATAPYVVGVRFFPDGVLAAKPTCSEPIVYYAEGKATVSALGGGGRGNIGGPFTDSADLGRSVQISKQGTEESECEAGLDRTISAASVSAQVDSPRPGALQFSYQYTLSGGHYDTVAACPLGKWVGKTGHDNSTSVSASITGRIQVVLRTETSPVLRVGYTALSNVNVRVVDPRGQPLAEIKPDPKGPPTPPGGDVISSSRLFRLDGSGAYAVEFSANVSVAQGGAGNDKKSARGVIETKVE